MSCGPHGGAGSLDDHGSDARLALVGSPNSGKTTLFNALTGLRAKTGNYPGVTVARYEGRTQVGDHDVLVEDLPGTYSLDAISPDEQIVADVLDPDDVTTDTPDGLVVTLDATTLRRSLGMLAQVLGTDLPACVVLTFTDELTRRQGSIDVDAFSRAIGVPVVAVVGGRRRELGALRELLPHPDQWTTPALPPPADGPEVTAWIESVLTTSRYRLPRLDDRTRRIDAVLLHPVWGTLVFFATMFAFFQVIFTVAAPLQDYVQQFFDYLAGLVRDHVGIDWLASFLGDAMIGGVGGVLVFLPQIALLFILIALLEGVGYMARAAFLMDKIMSVAGLEGRAFVALLSSLACAIPGIMATRTLPSTRDRLATMMAAPLMTCSARLPVYILLTGLLVDSSDRVGPFGAQGVVMFALYLGGAVSAMATAWLFSRIGRGTGPLLPFYMEMPPYRWPSVRSMSLSVWDACRGFVRKVGVIILVTTAALWLLLNLPTRGDSDFRAAGIDPNDDAATSSYVIEHSAGAAVGKFIAPVFAPLGFDWRINIGILASLSARETFVATLGQVGAAENPDDPSNALSKMRVTSGERIGEPLFTPPVLAALMVFFLYALQCMSTIGVMRRESGTWKWPAIAFGYMFVLAWVMAFAAHTIVAAVT
ncbi:iron transporter FeoB [Williamsia sp. Leaf354]|uniref:ferrous iron transporter B n=1 Tax=Williamsia sp. Leaf354 TaxID=1736349 RepID=UPI000702078A|nr:ferrous iron transporter B [Williamsia sp. Leaf354]KQR99408.1 iron transporter FeoB [Williamsia sp. Leaf354]